MVRKKAQFFTSCARRLPLYFSLFLISSAIIGPPLVSAQTEEEMKMLRMYFREDELVITSTRTPKPLSQVAENITVITAEEIEEMNYHTLLEVLNHISGLQVDLRTPWAGTVLMQGTRQEYSIVKIDGVTLNYLSSKTVDFGSIPVQNIERIEIIKGPASSVWGSSLGGIINIITKSAGDSEKFDGIISTSYGERDTGDFRVETSGRAGNVGVYIYAGGLQSDGFSPNAGTDRDSLYTKLKLDISETANVLFTFGYNNGSIGHGKFEISPAPPLINSAVPYSITDKFEHLFTTVSLNYSLTHDADLSLSLRTSQKDSEFTSALDNGSKYIKSTEKNTDRGASIKFALRKGAHNLVAGADYDRGKPDFNKMTDNSLVIEPAFCAMLPSLCSTTTTTIDQYSENWAVYANDTFVFNELSVTPGIRYDKTNVGGDFTSPSLGITYKVFEKTILRAYAARGFNTPTLAETHLTGSRTSNPDLDVQEVWSYHTGVETSAVSYLRLKVSFFRHDIKNAIGLDKNQKYVNRDKQRREGIEVEARTTPVYNTSLFAGYTYVDADYRTDPDERTADQEKVYDYAEDTWNIGVNYNDNKSFQATLKGHYIWWFPDPNYEATGAYSKYDDIICEINIIKKIHVKDRTNIETFLTAHNIFNGSQYLDGTFKNQGRWIEGGVKLRF